MLRMSVLTTICLLFVASTSVSAIAQDLSEAFSAYRRGDYAAAHRLFSNLAESGAGSAQFQLAIMYKHGEGVPADRTEAAKWLHRAAKQGHAMAQLHLGYSYEFGEGVARDLAKAANWQRRAAEQGLGAAQFNLGSMYERGLGVSRNLERAYIWFSIAASPFPTSDETHRYLAIQNRDRLAAELPLSVLLRAQRIAKNWRPRATIDAELFERKIASSGSGFRVSSEGHILTSAHVVNGCSELRIPPDNVVSLVNRDDVTDLALLKGPAGMPFAAFRQGRGIRPGAGVIVIGYPLRGVLASGTNVTVGNVAALAGPSNDRRLIQITAPLQPGNSGGPVLDLAGNVVGVAVAKLDAIEIARVTGDLPQNVNFAVSGGVTRAFLDSWDVGYITVPSTERKAPDEVAATASAFTVPVECLRER